MKFPTVTQVLALEGMSAGVQALADTEVAVKARQTIGEMKVAGEAPGVIEVMEHLAESLELRAQILASTALRNTLPEDAKVAGLTATTESINTILETASEAFGMPSLIRGENETV